MISLTKIKQTLKDCSFNPRADGPLKPVVDTVKGYPDYATLKASELLADYHKFGGPEKLKLAIQLIALRIAIDEETFTEEKVEDGPVQSKTEKGTGS